MSRQLRPRSIQSYEQALKLFARWLHEKLEIEEVEDVKEMAIRQYVLDLQHRGKYTFCADEAMCRINHPDRRTDFGNPISNITINSYLRNLKGFFTWLTEMEYLEKNPMKRVKMLPNQRNTKEYLEDAEVKALLSVMNRAVFSEYRDLMVMMLMLDSGTRLGETLSIESDQLDLINHSLYLPAEKTKGRKARTVFFSGRTARELRKWVKHKEGMCQSRLVFPVFRTGEALCVRNYEANFRKYLKRIQTDKHISPHNLRNNFAKRCLLSGMDIYTLSRILGHSSVTVTEKAYLDVKDQELRVKYVQHSPLERVYGR